MRAAWLLAFAGTVAGATADRSVAEWTIAMGGAVSLEGQSRRIRNVAELPAADFRIAVVDWVGVNVDPPDLARLAGLAGLVELHLPGPIWNRNADGGKDLSRDLRFLAPLESLRKLTFSYHFLDRIRFRDTGLAEIAKLANLEELAVRQSGVRGHNLAAFRNLRRLDVGITPFDDDGLKNLASATRLERLRIGDTLVTDAGLAHLESLAALQELDLEGTQITDAGLAHLRGLVKLTRLNLMGADVTDAGLAHLSALKALEELNLYRTKVTNAGLDGLKRLARLEEVDLRYTRATRSGVEALRAALPRIRVAFLDSSARTSTPVPARGPGDLAAWVRTMGGKSTATEISLASTAASDAHLEFVAAAKGLKKL
ncbi:MAG: leucine-rich repeat domain-containing protein, partial [Bryobacteraceae bacterium]